MSSSSRPISSRSNRTERVGRRLRRWRGSRRDRATRPLGASRNAALDPVFLDLPASSSSPKPGALRHRIIAVVELRAVGDQRIEKRIAVRVKRFQIGAVGDRREQDARRSAAPRDVPSARRRQAASAATRRHSVGPPPQLASKLQTSIAPDIIRSRQPERLISLCPAQIGNSGLVAHRRHVEPVVRPVDRLLEPADVEIARLRARRRPPRAGSSPDWRRPSA